MSSIKIDAFCPVGIGGTKGIDTRKLKLFIGGLLQKHTSKDLYDLFIKYGTIRESVVIPDRFRVRSRCYGFITFESESSVRKTLNNQPIITSEGIRLTVILASNNTKPRRAHFNVKHGISGHKPLPNVYENKEINETNSKNKKYSIKKLKNKKNECHSIGIYTDPSLFRTANIQQIAPAKFNINSNKNEKNEINICNENINKNINCKNNWPNEDIQKDFKNLTKMKTINVSQKDFKYKNKINKNWRLMSVKKEIPIINNKKNNKNKNSNKCDDICSIKSREWTPLNNKNNNPKKENENKNNEIEKEIESIISEGKMSYNSCNNLFNNSLIFNNNNKNNNNLNGLWSPYQPMFASNSQNYYNEYNFQNAIPTPPIQPIQPINKYSNNNNNFYGNEQKNLYYKYNNNYFCNNSVHSQTREM